MNKSLISEPLGLFGWKHLEPVILAALSSESPMLLIGKHGSAKSFLLERLAESLNMNFRCYNASLINYDDLVGIPIPINNNTSLSYISNPNSIWDAEVVFIDELNRTKPELQNKLFPIIYDKRVQGTNLTKLKYRWAAMNPPSNDDDDEEELSYIGAMPLDPALADRFPFIIEVPDWNSLNDEEKRNMLIDNYLGRHEFPIDIHELITKTQQKFVVLLKNSGESSSKYVITLMELLKNSFGYISARRATMFDQSLLYIYAALMVLGEYSNEEPSFQDAAFIHIQNTLPNLANEKIDKALLMNICQQALRLSNLEDSIDKGILLIGDPVERLKSLINNRKTVDIETINNVIPDSLSQLDIYRRRAMALFTYMAFRSNREIHAAVMETLANEVRPVMTTNTHKSMEHLRIKKIADKVEAVLSQVKLSNKDKNYLSNLLHSFLPDGYASEDDVVRLYAFYMKVFEELDL